MKVGVFDSGIGGLSMANAIRATLPELEIIVREDKEHVPYGLRAPQEILQFVTPIFQGLVDEGCQAIVVACNTVTTTLIDELRQRFVVPLIAVEPMIKPAAELTRTNVIAVCATPTTLKSQRYVALKEQYTRAITVLEPDCSDWAAMIEHRQIEEEAVASRINKVLDQKADVIVLACTHYHWIEEEIKELAGNKAQVIQPEEATIERLKQVLVQLP